MADLVIANAVVKAAIIDVPTSKPSSQALNITLSGRGRGLSGLSPEIEQTIEEGEGYYSGIREQIDTMMKTGNLPLSVRGNANTKAFAGKHGKQLILEVDYRTSAGASVIKEKYYSVITKCTPQPGSGGIVMIPVESVMNFDPDITVT